MRKITETSQAKDLAATADDFYGAPLLLEGEDRGRYQQYLACVRETVKPQDILERILVDDYVNYAWEVKRLRGLKAGLLNASCTRAPSTGGTYPRAAANMPTIESPRPA